MPLFQGDVAPIRTRWVKVMPVADGNLQETRDSPEIKSKMADVLPALVKK